MQRGHYDVEQRHKTAIKQLQYRYKKNFGRCNNLTMRLWANSGSSPVRTAINIENQCFTRQAPDFNIKLGAFSFIVELVFSRNTECYILSIIFNIAAISSNIIVTLDFSIKRFPPVIM